MRAIMVHNGSGSAVGACLRRCLCLESTLAPQKLDLLLRIWYGVRGSLHANPNAHGQEAR